MDPTHEENAKKFFEENPPFEKVDLPLSSEAEKKMQQEFDNAIDELVVNQLIMVANEPREIPCSFTLSRREVFPEDYCDIARRDYFYYNAHKYEGGKIPRGRKNWKAFELSEMIDCDPRYFNKGVEQVVKEITDIEDNECIKQVAESLVNEVIEGKL